MKLNKKGQNVTFQSAPTIVLLLVLVILIAAAGGTALSSFEQSQCSGAGGTWSGVDCTNAAGNVSMGDYSGNITGDGLNALDNYSGQVPTIGTMIGVGLILAVVIGVFAYFAKR